MITIDREIIDLVAPMFDGKDHIMGKVTRLGGTTSSGVCITEMGKTALFVEPTVAIALTTFKDFELSTQHIYGNHVCVENKSIIDEDNFMAQVALPLPSPEKCMACDLFGTCKARNMDKGSKLLTVTMAMFEKLFTEVEGELNPNLSPDKLDMRDAALKVDFLILDECHLYMTTGAVQVSAGIDVDEFEARLKGVWTQSLDKLFKAFRKLQRSYRAELAEIQDKAEKSPRGFHTLTLRVADPLLPRDVLGVGQKIRILARDRLYLGLSEDDIKNLQAMACVMSDDSCKLVYTQLKGTQHFNIVAASTSLLDAVHNYVKVNENVAVIFISGSAFRLNKNTYGNIIGRRLRQ